MRRFTILTFVVLCTFFICSSSLKNENTSKIKDNNEDMKQTKTLNEDDTKDIINDLLYKEYDKGIELSANTTIIINFPELDKTEGSDISIIIVNYTSEDTEKTYKYDGVKAISYTVENTGVYTVYASIKDKNGGEKTIDLTDDVSLSYKTDYEISDSNYVY